MNLSKLLQNLKSDKKKLIIIGAVALVAIALIDIVVFVLLTSTPDVEPIALVEKDSSVIEELLEVDSTKITISKILELYSDSGSYAIEKSSDTCEVTSKLSVNLSKLAVNVNLTYYLFPYPSNDEIERIVRLLNFRLGKIVDENGTDVVSIEKLEHDFNIFLKNSVHMSPYRFIGDAKVKLHTFKVELGKK